MHACSMEYCRTSTSCTSCYSSSLTLNISLRSAKVHLNSNSYTRSFTSPLLPPFTTSLDKHKKGSSHQDKLRQPTNLAVPAERDSFIVQEVLDSFFQLHLQHFTACEEFQSYLRLSTTAASPLPPV